MSIPSQSNASVPEDNFCVLTVQYRGDHQWAEINAQNLAKTFNAVVEKNDALVLERHSKAGSVGMLEFMVNTDVQKALETAEISLDLARFMMINSAQNMPAASEDQSQGWTSVAAQIGLRSYRVDSSSMARADSDGLPPITIIDGYASEFTPKKPKAEPSSQPGVSEDASISAQRDSLDEPDAAMAAQTNQDGQMKADVEMATQRDTEQSAPASTPRDSTPEDVVIEASIVTDPKYPDQFLMQKRQLFAQRVIANLNQWFADDLPPGETFSVTNMPDPTNPPTAFFIKAPAGMSQRITADRFNQAAQEIIATAVASAREVSGLEADHSMLRSCSVRRGAERVSVSELNRPKIQVNLLDWFKDAGDTRAAPIAQVVNAGRLAPGLVISSARMGAGHFSSMLFDRTTLMDNAFTHCIFDHCRFEKSVANNNNFRNAIIRRSSVNEGAWTNINLSHAKLNEVNFHNMTLSRVDLRSAHLNGVKFSGGMLNQCLFDQTRFDSCQINSPIQDALIEGATFTDTAFADAHNIAFVNCTLERVDLSQLSADQLSSVSLRNCKIQDLRLPDTEQAFALASTLGAVRRQSVPGASSCSYLYVSNLERQAEQAPEKGTALVVSTGIYPCVSSSPLSQRQAVQSVIEQSIANTKTPQSYAYTGAEFGNYSALNPRQRFGAAWNTILKPRFAPAHHVGVVILETLRGLKEVARDAFEAVGNGIRDISHLLKSNDPSFSEQTLIKERLVTNTREDIEREGLLAKFTEFESTLEKTIVTGNPAAIERLRQVIDEITRYAEHYQGTIHYRDMLDEKLLNNEKLAKPVYEFMTNNSIASHHIASLDKRKFRNVLSAETNWHINAIDQLVITLDFINQQLQKPNALIDHFSIERIRSYKNKIINGATQAQTLNDAINKTYGPERAPSSSHQYYRAQSRPRGI